MSSGPYYFGALTDIDKIAIFALVVGLLSLLYFWRTKPDDKRLLAIPVSLVLAQIPATIFTMLFFYGDAFTYFVSYLLSGLIILVFLSLYIGTLETEKGDDVATRLLLLDWIIEEDWGGYRVFSRGEARLLVHKDGDLVHLLIKDVGYPDDLITPELRDWIFSDTHTHTHTLNKVSEPEPTLTIQPPDVKVVRHTHPHTHTPKLPETDPTTHKYDE